MSITYYDSIFIYYSNNCFKYAGFWGFGVLGFWHGFRFEGFLVTFRSVLTEFDLVSLIQNLILALNFTNLKSLSLILIVSDQKVTKK